MFQSLSGRRQKDLNNLAHSQRVSWPRNRRAFLPIFLVNRFQSYRLKQRFSNFSRVRPFFFSKIRNFGAIRNDWLFFLFFFFLESFLQINISLYLYSYLIYITFIHIKMLCYTATRVCLVFNFCSSCVLKFNNLHFSRDPNFYNFCPRPNFIRSVFISRNQHNNRDRV